MRRLLTALVAAPLTVLLAALASVLAPRATGAQTLVEQSNWRWDEDWSVLRNAPPGAASEGPWWLPAKYVSLSDDGSLYASFGLETRVRYEGYRNNLWGSPGADDGYLWLRMMPHVDIHAGAIRAFAQLIAADARGVGDHQGPADATGIDALQAFLDLRVPVTESGTLTLRGGRALMPLGSERLVGARYGPNMPQAFDGGRVMFDHGPVHVDLVAVRPVAVGPDDFDDETSHTRRLNGVYTTARLTEKLSIDAYWLDYRNADATFEQGSGREHRHTFGVRVFGRDGGWSWNWEAMLQDGTFGSDRIRAWSLATETGYRFGDLPLKPRVLLRANIASGDGNPSDGRLGTFNAMFPKGKYFGELSPIGPYNIINVHPGIEFDLGQGVSLGFAGIAFWRESLRDGLYDVPGQLIRAGDTSKARFVGTQGEVVLGWQADAALSLTGSFSVFQPGAFIRETGPARTIYMVGAEAMYRF